jgi:hypothetical protein
MPCAARCPCRQVLLLSARDALLARQVLSGRAGPDTLRRFSRLAFGAFGVPGAGLGLARGKAGKEPPGPTPEQVRPQRPLHAAPHCCLRRMP